MTIVRDPYAYPLRFQRIAMRLIERLGNLELWEKVYGPCPHERSERRQIIDRLRSAQ